MQLVVFINFDEVEICRFINNVVSIFIDLGYVYFLFGEIIVVCRFLDMVLNGYKNIYGEEYLEVVWILIVFGIVYIM